METDRQLLSFGLVRSTAIAIFKENDAYDDEKGLHPNTIRRSSEKAVEKIASDFGITFIDLYSSLQVSESLPDINFLRQQGFSTEDIERSIKTMFTVLVHKDIVASSPNLVSDQEYRLKQYGRL